MATTARERVSLGRAPDYRTANDAIDSILASAAFDQRRVALRRQYKAAERTFKTTSRRELARGRAYEKAGEALQGTATSVNYANEQQAAAARRLEQMNERWRKEAEQQAEAWSAEFAAKPKYTDLEGKERRKAWQAYYERQARRLDIYQQVRTQQSIYDRLMARAQSAYGGYQSQAEQLNAYQRRYEQMGKRSKQAYDAYVAATKRYNAFSRFVPYQPA